MESTSLNDEVKSKIETRIMCGKQKMIDLKWDKTQKANLYVILVLIIRLKKNIMIKNVNLKHR